MVYNFRTTIPSSVFYVKQFIIRYATPIEIDIEKLNYDELLTLQFGINKLIVRMS